MTTNSTLFLPYIYYITGAAAMITISTWLLKRYWNILMFLPWIKKQVSAWNFNFLRAKPNYLLLDKGESETLSEGVTVSNVDDPDNHNTIVQLDFLDEIQKDRITYDFQHESNSPLIEEYTFRFERYHIKCVRQGYKIKVTLTKI